MIRCILYFQPTVKLCPTSDKNTTLCTTDKKQKLMERNTDILDNQLELILE